MTFVRAAVGVLTFATTVAVLCATALCTPAGTVRVRATTGKPAKPVAFVSVSLYGPQNVRGITGASGVTTLQNLAPGTYTVIINAVGYRSTSAPPVTVTAGHTSVVNIVLVRFVPKSPMPTFTPPPHLIAVVAATPKPQVTPDAVDAKSPQARLSNSLLSALGTLPGVALQGNGISIDGHSAAQTQATVDGVPVAGSASNLSLFGTDIFSEIGVNGRTSTVSFSTRAPTLDWLAHVKEVQGSLDASQFSISEGGTAGRLGIAATHATAQSAGPLEGMRFLDASGLDYVHDALTQASANTLTLRFPFSQANVVTASATAMRSSTPNVCNVFTGLVPCGYGPYDRTNSSLYTARVRDAFSAGRVNGNLTLFSSGNDFSIDGSGEYVAGVADSQYGSSVSRRAGLLADWSVQLTRDFGVHFNVSSSSQSGSTTSSAANRQTEFQSANVTMFSAGLDAPIVSSKRFASNVEFTTSSQNGFSSDDARLNVSYRPTDVDTLRASMDVGGALMPPISESISFDPENVTFDCAAHNALGYGPSVSTNDTTSTDESLTWNHAGDKLSSAFSLSHQVSRNAPVYGIVGASALSPSLFPSSFMSDVNAAAQGACGAGTPYALSDMYYELNGIADRAVYDSAHETLSLTPSPYLHAQLALGLTSARAYGAGLPLFTVQSTIGSGRQTPGTPYATASLSVAGVVGRGGTTLLGVAQYTSKNNFSNLPAYTVLNAGIEIPLARGQISASMLNIANEYPGPFARSVGSVPLPTANGQYQSIAYPLAPRTFQVTYQVQIGHNAESVSARREPNAPRVLPYDVAGPRDPLEIDGQSEECGPEMLPVLRTVNDAIRAYERRIEAARTADGYPAAFPDVAAGPVHLTYRPNGASYVILLGSGGKTFADILAYQSYYKALLGCQTWHMGALSQAQHVGLYVPSYAEETALTAFYEFAPTYGFYTVPSLIEEPKATLAPFPASSPAKPFAINNAADCDASRRGAAQAFLDAFASYANAFFGGRTLPALPPGLTVDAESAPSAFLLLVGDRDFLQQVEPCMVVHGVTLGQLTPLGLSAGRPGTLYYAPRLGFYTLSGAR